MGSYANLHFINNSSIDLISSISASAASVHQHQRISSISASATSAHQHQQHQCIGYGHWKIYLPIYIKSGHISLYPLTSPDELQTLPDMLQTPPDTIRYGPDTTRYHHTCIMYGLYGLKHHTVEISEDVTNPDVRTDKQQTTASGLWTAEFRNNNSVKFHSSNHPSHICLRSS